MFRQIRSPARWRVPLALALAVTTVHACALEVFVHSAPPGPVAPGGARAAAVWLTPTATTAGGAPAPEATPQAAEALASPATPATTAVALVSPSPTAPRPLPAAATPAPHPAAMVPTIDASAGDARAREGRAGSESSAAALEPMPAAEPEAPVRLAQAGRPAAGGGAMPGAATTASPASTPLHTSAVAAPVPASGSPAAAHAAASASPGVGAPASAAAVAAVAEHGGDPPPVYPTRLPPASTLRYDLSSGFLSGIGELLWRPEGARYTLQLEGRVTGLRVITQVSSGDLGSTGLAPQRYTDRRIGGSVQAANFQRDKGKVTFSGSPSEYPIVPAMQDRLSWMIQLPAIVAANPALASPGSTIDLAVVSARGDADHWLFRCTGREEVQTALGPVVSARFTRLPRKPYDTEAHVWLDPARQYLPVRARLVAKPKNDVLDMVMREVAP